MSSKTRFAFALILALAVAGCINSRDKFDEFSLRVVDAGVVGDCEGVEADITGEFLLAVSPIVAPNSQLLFLSTITSFPENPSSVNASFQPLKVGDKTASGDPIVEDNILIGSNNCLETGIVGTVAGAANPISGQTISADILLTAEIVSADLWCGTVTGTANMTIDLGGSTFAATRIDGERGDELPDVPDRCPDE